MAMSLRQLLLSLAYMTGRDQNLHRSICLCPASQAGGATATPPSYVLDPPFFFSLKDAPVLFSNEYGTLQGPSNSDLPVLDDVNMKVGGSALGAHWKGKERERWTEFAMLRHGWLETYSGLPPHPCIADTARGHATMHRVSTGQPSEWRRGHLCCGGQAQVHGGQQLSLGRGSEHVAYVGRSSIK